MRNKYSTVEEVLESPFYTEKDIVRRLVRDPITRKEYEVTGLTEREATCAEMKSGRITSFKPEDFDRFEVLSPEVYEHFK